MISESQAGELILELHRATHATLTALQARLADLDLTAAEINSLAILASGQQRSIGELAAAAATKPTTLTSVLDRLVRRGLVVRQLDPADRRSFLVSLTQDGRSAANRARAEMRAIERTVQSAVTGADLAGFRNVTQAIMEVPR